MSLGGVLASPMTMQDGTMQNCPFMGVSALCTMSIADHLAQWQDMFASIVSPITTVILLLLIALSIFLGFIEDFRIHKRPLIKFVSHHQREAQIFDTLRLAFARGLIHPKIY